MADTEKVQCPVKGLDCCVQVQGHSNDKIVLINDFCDYILWTVEPFVTNMQCWHNIMSCCVKIKVDWLPQRLIGYHKGWLATTKVKVTVRAHACFYYIIWTADPLESKPSLVVHHHKPRFPVRLLVLVFKVKDTATVKLSGEHLPGCYLLNHWNFSDKTRSIS